MSATRDPALDALLHPFVDGALRWPAEGALFLRAREDAVFQIVELNRQHGHVPAPNFLHFSVVVGPAGFHSPEDGIPGIPFDSPLARPAIDGSLAGMPIRIHRVALSGTIELEITASLLPGQLQNRFVFSGDPGR